MITNVFNINQKILTKNKQDYAKALQSNEWNSLRKKILNRDNYICKKCGSKDKLEVHHKEYFLDEKNIFFKPNEYPLGSLTTLCHDCHHTLHQKIKIPSKKVNKMKLLKYFRNNFSKNNQETNENDEFVNNDKYNIDHLDIQKSPFETVEQIVLENYSTKGFDDAKIISDIKFLNDNIEKLQMDCIVKTDMALQRLNLNKTDLKIKADNLKSLGIINALSKLESEILNLERDEEKIIEYKNDFENGGKFWNAICLSYQNGFKEGIVASQQ